MAVPIPTSKLPASAFRVHPRRGQSRLSARLAREGEANGDVRPDEFAIDGEALAEQIEGACREFERNGYPIVSILPKVDGSREMGLQAGAGWSSTVGVIVVARRVASNGESSDAFPAGLPVHSGGSGL